LILSERSVDPDSSGIQQSGKKECFTKVSSQKVRIRYLNPDKPSKRVRQVAMKKTCPPVQYGGDPLR